MKNSAALSERLTEIFRLEKTFKILTLTINPLFMKRDQRKGRKIGFPTEKMFNMQKMKGHKQRQFANPTEEFTFSFIPVPPAPLQQSWVAAGEQTQHFIEYL